MSGLVEVYDLERYGVGVEGRAGSIARWVDDGVWVPVEWGVSNEYSIDESKQ